MIFSKAEAGCAPARKIPLMKKPGVPERPIRTPDWTSCSTCCEYRQQVEQDVQSGVRIGLSGTPGFFINGIFLAGAQPASAFEKIIDEELVDAGQKHVN